MTATDSAGAPSPSDEEAPPPDPNAVQVTINGVPHTARKGQLVIEAAAAAGHFIPRFCYHERMTPVGKCRMCLVEADSGRGPAVTVSCMVPVAPDMKIETESPMTKRMQEGVLELLLANHPLDCPVCDKGGECPLQDQTMSHGPGESRFVEEKRHYEKPIPISDLVFLDRERCILCDRCTRFADEVAGDPLIHFISRGNTTQVMTFPEEPFSSYFSGNTVQICPVGALTAKPYRFKARPWDLEEVESTCTTCAVGCRTVVQSSRDQLVRYQGVDSEPVNWSWLCDRGRFGFEAVNSEQRLTEPMIRTEDGLVTTSWNVALGAAVQVLRDAIDAGGPSSVAVIGGARGTNEDAFAWARLAHDVIGTPHVDAQLADGLPVDVLGLPRATIADLASASTIVLLGPDLKEELPVLHLRVRDAVQKRRAKLVEFTPRPTGITASAWRSIGYEPGTQVQSVRDALADPALAAQLASGRVVVVAGRANLAETSDATVEALHVLLGAVPHATVLPAFRRGNVVGALLAGMRPGAGGLDARGALQAAADGRLECLVLVGADPLADVPDTDLVRRALAGARRVISVDTHPSSTTQRADVVLPAAAYAEKAGTTTNLEGRVTALGRKVTAAGTSRPDWMIALALASALGTDLGHRDVDDLTDALADAVPEFAGITRAALASAPDGILTAPLGGTAPAAPSGTSGTSGSTASIPVRNSYDFRLVVGRKLYDAAVGTQHSPSMAHLAVGQTAHLHPLDIERASVSAGSEVRVSSPRATVVMRVEPDDTVARGTVWVPFNQPGGNVGDLIDATAPVTDVRIENL